VTVQTSPAPIRADSPEQSSNSTNVNSTNGNSLLSGLAALGNCLLHDAIAREQARERTRTRTFGLGTVPQVTSSNDVSSSDVTGIPISSNNVSSSVSDAMGNPISSIPGISSSDAVNSGTVVGSRTFRLGNDAISPDNANGCRIH